MTGASILTGVIDASMNRFLAVLALYEQAGRITNPHPHINLPYLLILTYKCYFIQMMYTHTYISGHSRFRIIILYSQRVRWNYISHFLEDNLDMTPVPLLSVFLMYLLFYCLSCEKSVVFKSTSAPFFKPHNPVMHQLGTNGIKQVVGMKFNTLTQPLMSCSCLCLGVFVP